MASGPVVSGAEEASVDRLSAEVAANVERGVAAAGVGDVVRRDVAAGGSWGRDPRTVRPPAAASRRPGALACPTADPAGKGDVTAGS
jgi:hypothetical protein